MSFMFIDTTFCIVQDRLKFAKVCMRASSLIHSVYSSTIVQILKHVPVFAKLERSELEELAMNAQLQSFEAGEHIFNKGDDSYTSNSYNEAGSTYEGTPDGISLINNGPGVYLARYEKEVVILIYMDTIGTEPSAKRKPIIVRNMPIVKWFSLILIAKANVLYVYINGRLKHSKLFTDAVFKQNYDDINVNTSGVNWGDLSSLTYFPRALNGLEIQASVLAGPDRKKRIDTTTKFDESPSYLSSNWYAN